MHEFGEVRHTPHQLWYVIAGVGIVTTLLMVLYNHLVKPGEAEV